MRLQELEDRCGVKLAFVENQFGSGAAGALSFNVMAAVAQYYSDNLRQEVLKGIDEKARQGFPLGHAPFGYVMCHKDESVAMRPHPERAKAVQRVFELYATGSMTMRQVADRMEKEGYAYRPSQPRFFRTAMSQILSNRLYIGEVVRHGVTHKGRFEPIVERHLFDECRRLLQGKNRRNGYHNGYLAGGLFQCAHCGYSVTSERVHKRLANGGVNTHFYYRCGNCHPDEGHPKVRYREADLEAMIVRDLAAMQIDDAELRTWFRASLVERFNGRARIERDRLSRLQERLKELKVMQERLLDAYMKAVIDEAKFSAKSTELQREEESIQKQIASCEGDEAVFANAAVAIFDFSQTAAETWASVDQPIRRRMIEAILLNGKL